MVALKDKNPGKRWAWSGEAGVSVVESDEDGKSGGTEADEEEVEGLLCF